MRRKEKQIHEIALLETQALSVKPELLLDTRGVWFKTIKLPDLDNGAVCDLTCILMFLRNHFDTLGHFKHFY